MAMDDNKTMEQRTTGSWKEMMENKPSGSESGLCLAENYVKKFYLDDLGRADRYEVEDVQTSICNISLSEQLMLYKIKGIVFNKNENVQDRLNNVYSAVHGLNLSLIFLLRSDGEKIEFYLGTKRKSDAEEKTEALKKVFLGNFPGSELEETNPDGYDDLLKKVLLNGQKCAVASLTSLPSLKNTEVQNDQYIQGLEKFVDAMQGEVYSILIISDPVTGGQIEKVKQGYEELYSEIAPLGEYSLTMAENEGISVSNADMDGYTDTIGRSVSKTQSFTTGSSVTKSESTTTTLGVGMGMMGSTGSMESFTANVQKNALKSLVAAFKGGSAGGAIVSGVTQAIGGNLGVNGSRAKQKGVSEGENESHLVGNQDTEQNSHSVMAQKTHQEGISKGSSTSSMVKYENKSIKVFLQCIDDHLKRLKECENYGMWSSAAYFISPDKETSTIAASTYKGIINGEETALESSSINTWFKKEDVKKLSAYLCKCAHPKFSDKEFQQNFTADTGITPSTMLSTKELSVQCGIPYKSIPGVYVREMAGFGRNIYDSENLEGNIPVGVVYHMGEKYDNQKVRLSLDKLREHTFVTGSTGSGKSNTVYQIVSELNKKENSIPTLILEPAKGEYKQVFGEEFNVFGTNPELTELLRINPFKFEQGIHVLEHIDRLIDIFNVCWPMYAAMPAVLKEAVEDSYRSCGWDLYLSQNTSGYNIYPSFGDLLVSLRKVIKSSDYSQEVKDNYTGSLITRVKSLTNGLNGEIFSSNEVDSVRLFDESTIVDLSRVGSSETKAMIMGVIVIRLQERKIAKGGINLPLEHVTIIEEAHNLLKKTSSEQTTEGANLQGKSVEMISNAIAEMRTYGEGFIIVDQAPGLLDMSAIRNTNTKIIMHLPDLTDRELVGKAAGLSDDQIEELAKLPRGVAAIYQNRWVEPVLTMINHYVKEPKVYSKKDKTCNKNIELGERTKLLLYLVSLLSKNQNIDETDAERIKKWLIGADIEAKTKVEIFSLLDSKKLVKKETAERLITELADNAHIAFEAAKDSQSVEEWNAELLRNMEIDKTAVSEGELADILECVIHHRSLEYASDEENFYKWMNYMGRRRL